MNQKTKHTLLTLATFLIGYLFLHSAYYSTAKNPYAQEIVLIVLGTVATILITAALLNKQSELELEKEYQIKVFELKSSLYLDLINFLEKIVIKGKISKEELIYIEFLTHKIAIIASEEVLHEYSSFIDTLKIASRDMTISEVDADMLCDHLAKVSIKIRYDLIRDADRSEEIERIILRNADKF